MDGQSVQLKADANLILLAVQVTPDFLSNRKIDQEEGGLRNRLAALTDKLQLDNRMLEVYQQEEQMLIKKQQMTGRAVDLKETLDLQRVRLTDIYQRSDPAARTGRKLGFGYSVRYPRDRKVVID